MNILIKNLMIPLLVFFLFGYKAESGFSSAVAQQDRDSVAAASMNQAGTETGRKSHCRQRPPSQYAH